MGGAVALCGVGRSALPGDEEEKVHEGEAKEGRDDAGDDAAAGSTTTTTVSVVADKLSFEGGVGGRRGKRPRRYFFP